MVLKKDKNEKLRYKRAYKSKIIYIEKIITKRVYLNIDSIMKFKIGNLVIVFQLKKI